MAKNTTTRYWYQCVAECDLIWLGPDPRTERHPPNTIAPPTVNHYFRFVPVSEYKKIEQHKTSWLFTEGRPLARSYTETMVKPRRMMPGGAARTLGEADAPEDGTGKRGMGTMRSRVKFRLLDPDDLTDHIKRVALTLPLIEVTYTDPEEWLTEEEWDVLQEQDREDAEQLVAADRAERVEKLARARSRVKAPA